jgi:hypothetical protein
VVGLPGTLPVAELEIVPLMVLTLVSGSLIGVVIGSDTLDEVPLVIAVVDGSSITEDDVLNVTLSEAVPLPLDEARVADPVRDEVTEEITSLVGDETLDTALLEELAAVVPTSELVLDDALIDDDDDINGPGTVTYTVVGTSIVVTKETEHSSLFCPRAATEPPTATIGAHIETPRILASDKLNTRATCTPNNTTRPMRMGAATRYTQSGQTKCV